MTENQKQDIRIGDLCLTKRELFAAMAMQGGLTAGLDNVGVIVKTAVSCADALLAELEKTVTRAPPTLCKSKYGNHECFLYEGHSGVHESASDINKPVRFWR